MDAAKAVTNMAERQTRRAAEAAEKGEEAAPTKERKLRRGFQQRPERAKAQQPRVSASVLSAVFGTGQRATGHAAEGE